MVAIVLTVMTAVCGVFLVKSYRAGVKLGMDRKVLRRAITLSATFTLLPGIGSLQYERNVVEIAAQTYGLSGLKLEELSSEAFITIALVLARWRWKKISCNS